MTAPRPTVIHIISSSGFYGAENVVANLAGAMPDTPTVIFCICKQPESVKEFQQRVSEYEHCRFITSSTDFSTAWTKLSHLITEVENPVLHSHGYKEVVLGLLLRIRFQYLSSQIRVLPPLLNTQHGFVQNSRKSHIYNQLGIWACRSKWVAKTFCVTQAIKERYLKNGIHPERLELLPNAIANEQKYLSERETNAPIVFVGRFSKEKNPELFIRAFNNLTLTSPALTGVMLGEGPLFDEMKRLVIDLGLEGKLELRGFQKDARSVIESARLLAITSTTEGIPLVALEAMASGTPVISTKVGGMPELINSNHNGLLVNALNPQAFADACQKALADQSLYQALQSNAHKTIAENHNLTTQAERILSDYTDLLSKRISKSVGAAS